MISYRVLSCDGGGVRGIITARLLQRLQAACPNWIDTIDLFAGTSTGAIISVGLACGYTPDSLFDLYYNRTKEIFSRSGIRLVTGQIFSAKYNNVGLRKVILDTFGDISIGEVKKNILVSSLDLDGYDGMGHRVYKPKFFHNLIGQDKEELSLKVADILMYTTAAPTYFPVFDGYVDGGLVANNPSLAALSQSLDPKTIPVPTLQEIALLSIGTGKTSTYIEGDHNDWGFIQWAMHIVELMMNCRVEVTDYECKQLLKNNYCRVNTYLNKDFKLDSIDALDKMVEAS
jgi:patatin-like phospholipase/acyl hydrolase